MICFQRGNWHDRGCSCVPRNGISRVDACGALDGHGVGGASLLGLGAGTLNAYMGETTLGLSPLFLPVLRFRLV